MSLQVFLQAQMLGAEEFLEARPANVQNDALDLMGRCAWLGLITEVLPRALLAELKLSRMLLGSSSAEQFLLVLAEEDIPRAEEFLNNAARAIAGISGDTLRLVWATTENLGAWPVARKRLDDALQVKVSAPLADIAVPSDFFSPGANRPESADDGYFESFGEALPVMSSAGWSPEDPARLSSNGGTYSWPLREQSEFDEEGILFPRRFAMDESGLKPSSLRELAGRADGTPRWSILRGDVDHFDVQLRRVNSIEEHIHLSVLFKEFFAGELSVLCTLPDFWRKVTILFRGGDGFAVIGSWDALILLAHELQRLFDKFIEQNFQSLPSLEGRTLSMALAIAPATDVAAHEVFQEAGRQLHNTKASDVGTFHLFGRSLEWKRLTDAEDLKAGLLRLVREFGCAPDYIHDLASVYREAFAARTTRRNKPVAVEKPWRTYMRLSRVIPQARGKEFNAVRSAVITSLVGRGTASLKLRPSARVGLEWARFAAGS